jgi:MarR family transcriptional regulator, 2-MHQ and catechol-resistance regulon repressor
MDATSRHSRSRKGVHLWLLFWRTTKALEVYARRSVEATGLCLSDFGVLEALLHKGPSPVSAFGAKILVSSGSVTAAVDRLVRNGLVERVDAAKDRRSRIVHLTAKGSELIEGLFEEHARDMEQAFSLLSGPERDGLARLLRKLGHDAAGRKRKGRSRATGEAEGD